MSQARVLVADDSPTILKVVSSMLEGEGYEVITATNGVEAAEKAFQEMPDLILLDVVMPRMDGYQVCRLLKSESSTRHIPIAILTSRDQARDKFWGLQTGADEYISKGTDQAQLMEIVHRLIDKGGVVKPLSKGNVPHPFQQVDILERSNKLLDRTLYEATVINEIAKLVNSLQNYEETIQTTLALLHKLLDYSVAVLVMAHGEEDSECIIKPWMPFISKSEVENLYQNALNVLRPYLPQEQQQLEFPVQVLGGEREVDTNRPAGVEMEKMVYVPVKGKGKVAGLIGVIPKIGVTFTSDDEDTLRLVANHAYMVIENAWLYEEIRKLSMKDGLTRVFNRRYLDERLTEEFKKVFRYNKRLCVLMMDLDHFKQVNDRYGHQAGDMVLRRVTECCRDAVRSTDVIGRYGGEEFMIILPETDISGGMMVAERIRSTVENAMIKTDAGEIIRVTVSLGACDLPRAGVESVEQLVEKVDQALYEAKRRGRNQVCVYNVEGADSREPEAADVPAVHEKTAN